MTLPHDSSTPSTAPATPALVPVASTYLRVGQIVGGRYEVRGRLGVGGMGAVYRVYDRTLSDEVALKILRLNWVSNARAPVRFGHEVRLARKISHPNVCRVFDLGEADGLVFLTMELLPGETLRARIARGIDPLHARLRLFEQIARGLAAIHAQGILHRDLKPENVLVRRDGTAVVSDFGLAMVPDESNSSVGVAGTPMYMSPEQLRGDVLDPRSDVFALGLLGYELLTGKRPFGDGSQAVVTGAILRDPPVPPLITGLDVEIASVLADLLLLALAKAPEERWPSASAVANALAEIGATATPPAAIDEPRSSPTVPRKRAVKTATVGVAPIQKSGGAMGATVRIGALAVFTVGLLDRAGVVPPDSPPLGSVEALVTRFSASPAAGISAPIQAPRPTEPRALPVMHSGKTISFANSPLRVKLRFAVKQVRSDPIPAVVDGDGSTYAWGYRGGNRVRAGEAPYHVSHQYPFRTLVTTAGFPLLLGDDGTLATWPWEGAGNAERLLWLSNVIAAAAGSAHVVALHRDRTVSLAAVDTVTSPPKPVQIPGLFNVAAVAACDEKPGFADSAAMLSDGTIVTWSYHASQWGLPESTAVLPTGEIWTWSDRTGKYNSKVGHTQAPTEGRPNPWPGFVPPKTEIVGLRWLPPLRNAVALAFWDNSIRSDSILALDRDGSVYCWKGRWDKIFGLPRITSISTSGKAAAALDEHGAVWVWGEFAIGSQREVAVQSPAKVEGLPIIESISINVGQSLAVDNQGGLWAWGHVTGT